MRVCEMQLVEELNGQRAIEEHVGNVPNGSANANGLRFSVLPGHDREPVRHSFLPACLTLPV